MTKSKIILIAVLLTAILAGCTTADPFAYLETALDTASAERKEDRAQAEAEQATAQAQKELEQALQTDFNEADFTVTLTADQKGVVIQKYNGSSKAGRIPALIQGMPVRVIGGFGSSDVTAVVIPEGVTLIESSAFRNSELRTVVIPEGVTEIGADAFRETPLTSITLPQSLTTIGSAAFAYTPLTTIILPQKLTSIGQGAFYGTQLIEITIPGSVKEVRNIFGAGRLTRSLNYETRGNQTLTTITLSEGVSLVDGFNNCDALTTLNLPNSLKIIGGFAGCDSLTTLSLPNGIAGIDSGAFALCSALSTVTLPSSLKVILGADGDNPPDGKVRSFGRSWNVNGRIPAFQNCPSLTTVTFPDSAIYIHASTFSGCSKLNLATQAAINKQRAAVKELSTGAFMVYEAEFGHGGFIIIGYNGTVPRTLVIPNEIMGIPVTDIDVIGRGYNGAFYDYNTLTSVTLPSTIVYIGDEEFSECSNLTTVTIPSSVKVIRFGSSSFYHTKLNQASRDALRRVGYTGRF